SATLVFLIPAREIRAATSCCCQLAVLRPSFLKAVDFVELRDRDRAVALSTLHRSVYWPHQQGHCVLAAVGGGVGCQTGTARTLARRCWMAARGGDGRHPGIGLAAAKDFARRGAAVILACRNLQKCHTYVANHISATGGDEREGALLGAGPGPATSPCASSSSATWPTPAWTPGPRAQRVTVNAVEPGFTDTEYHRSMRHYLVSRWMFRLCTFLTFKFPFQGGRSWSKRWSARELEGRSGQLVEELKRRGAGRPKWRSWPTCTASSCGGLSEGCLPKA
uniref:Estradiol 17-beta-dehydrogenase 2 n=1 Tax=Macrostomum lignano TaxID=282301 RepID=A0A1I8FNW1_9PLAT